MGKRGQRMRVLHDYMKIVKIDFDNRLINVLTQILIKYSKLLTEHCAILSICQFWLFLNVEFKKGNSVSNLTYELSALFEMSQFSLT